MQMLLFLSEIALYFSLKCRDFKTHRTAQGTLKCGSLRWGARH